MWARITSPLTTSIGSFSQTRSGSGVLVPFGSAGRLGLVSVEVPLEDVVPEGDVVVPDGDVTSVEALDGVVGESTSPIVGTSVLGVCGALDGLVVPGPPSARRLSAPSLSMISPSLSRTLRMRGGDVADGLDEFADQVGDAVADAGDGGSGLGDDHGGGQTEGGHGFQGPGDEFADDFGDEVADGLADGGDDLAHDHHTGSDALGQRPHAGDGVGGLRGVPAVGVGGLPLPPRCVLRAQFLGDATDLGGDVGPGFAEGADDRRVAGEPVQCFLERLDVFDQPPHAVGGDGADGVDDHRQHFQADADAAESGFHPAAA
ncbi:hypothetical protein JOF41_003610 [Saccharothrix coeruleofusca]|uniref:hypothetical protein n=1 Tax=Saccharothrix coeruleofusca TaxID=33919 RepID=UPI0027DDE9F3|nr:hypothetical protein [Saccharothrix coeruleofusca]MBP2337432.1 hypothetical protein [Saccharothrix coeruleofusca]